MKQDADKDTDTYTSFAEDRLIFSGSLKTMLLETKKAMDSGEAGQILIFDDRTGAQIDFDFRGTPADVLQRLGSHPLFAAKSPEKPRRTGPGRPRLGVVSREVSLLPRHWEWLEQQPNGISAALRWLVEEARKNDPDKGRARMAMDAAGRFMSSMAGNLPGFEEASRALFAWDRRRLRGLVSRWPEDVRKHLLRLVSRAARLKQAEDGDAGTAAKPES